YSTAGGDKDKALELARKAKTLMPKEPTVSDTLGWLYTQHQLYSTAIPLLQEAIKAEPNKPEYHMHLAVTLSRFGKNDQAKVELASAVKLDAKIADRPEAKEILAAK